MHVIIRETNSSRVIHNKGREYDEYGFCITAPGEGSLQSRANYLQKQSQALANQVQVSCAVLCQ